MNPRNTMKQNVCPGLPRHMLHRSYSHSTPNDALKKTETKGETVNKSITLHDDHFTPQQMDILKNTICKGVTNEEFEVFLMACIKTKLDPFMKQIYAVKRRGKKPDGTWGETMSIQTGIDGYRLIAERTERYAPGQEPTYTYDQNGHLASATAYVKKMTKDGTWHTVSSSAYIDEYCQKTREGQPMGMWANMPRTMLAKCAESQALRKAFPAEMSGLYTKEEMAQAEVDVVPVVAPVKKINKDQAYEIGMILEECDQEYVQWFYDYLIKKFGSHDLCNVPAEFFDRMKDGATKNMEMNHARQRRETELANSLDKEEETEEAEQLASELA